MGGSGDVVPGRYHVGIATTSTRIGIDANVDATPTPPLLLKLMPSLGPVLNIGLDLRDHRLKTMGVDTHNRVHERRCTNCARVQP
jgi:hypothetical protein